MTMSQFNKDNDVFSDCGIRRRCAPNHFQLTQNRYRSGVFCNSDGRISSIFSTRRGITYGKTLISCFDTKMSFWYLRERRRYE
jgi:hypothetical protein